MLTLSNNLIINDEEVRFNPDFRCVLLMFEIAEDDVLFPAQKKKLIVENFEVEHSDIEEAYKAIRNWFANESIETDSEESEEGEPIDEPIMDYKEDAELIYSAFLQQYGIDLWEIEFLHWHKFKALLLGLTENTQFKKVIEIRSIDLSKIKDRETAEHYRKLKSYYALPNKQAEKALQEFNMKGW